MNKQIPSDLQKTLLSEEVALLSDLHYMQEADDERELDNIIKGYEQLLKSVFQCSKRSAGNENNDADGKTPTLNNPLS